MNPAHPTTNSRRGFSLLEVLLATFILGIGLIMVASVFPVGANWTRESTQNSVGQTIALNAVSVIKSHYGPDSLDPIHGPAGTGRLSQIVATNVLQPLPAFAEPQSLPNSPPSGIPLSERCYQFGSDRPFPAANPTVCLYYWTALTRETPGTVSGSHDLYIFVFRKGDATQTFRRIAGSASSATDPNGFVSDKDSGGTPYKELVTGGQGLRDFAANPQPTPGAAVPTPSYFPQSNSSAYYDWAREPTLVVGPYNAGKYDSTRNPPIRDAFPPIGYVGVGESSGTVFRQTLSLNYTNVTTSDAKPVPSIDLTTPERIIYAPAADGVAGSPLIYVYQTTVPF